MRIFLTGGTGFIGSHFISRAIAAGHTIIAQRRSEASRPKIPLLQEPVWLDRSLPELEPKDLEGCDAVVHLAAHSANVPYDKLENCVIHNVLEPINLFRAGIAAGVRRFVVAGSCFEYGRSCDRFDFIPTDAPLEPTNRYAASKAAASVIFNSIAVEENIELVILRIFQVYGEGELESRFWPTLRRKALAGEDMPMSSGVQIRDFVPVGTVADSFIKAVVRHDVTPGNPLIENIGTGNACSLAEFADQEWSRFGASGKLSKSQMPMRPGEAMRIVPQLKSCDSGIPTESEHGR